MRLRPKSIYNNYQCLGMSASIHVYPIFNQNFINAGTKAFFIDIGCAMGLHGLCVTMRSPE